MTLALNGRITLLCGLLATSGAFAGEPLQVTLSADEYDGICDAHCSLRDAITAANQAGGAQHIRLAPGNHVLSRPSLPDASGLAGDEDDNLDGDVDVLGELTIQGSGEEQTRIISQVESRLFEVRPGARLSLLRLSLENGRSGRNGSAQIYASTFQRSMAMGLYYGNNFGRGGAIFNTGTGLLKLSNSTLSNNWSTLYNGYVESPSEAVPSATLINVSIAATNGPVLANRGEVLIRNSLMVGNYDPYESDQAIDCIT